MVKAMESPTLCRTLRGTWYAAHFPNNVAVISYGEHNYMSLLYDAAVNYRRYHSTAGTESEGRIEEVIRMYRFLSCSDRREDLPLNGSSGYQSYKG